MKDKKTNMAWIIEKEGNIERTYDVKSKLLMDRILFLDGEVRTENSMDIIAKLLYLNSVDAKAPIHLYIQSPGGSCSAGLAIYDVINFISAPVYTYCLNMAASMGAFLLSSGAKGHRYALPNAEVMIHQPLISGGGISGQATDIMIHAENMQKLKEKLTKILAKNCGQDYKKVLAACERDNYLTSEEALKFGLIDKIIEKKN